VRHSSPKEEHHKRQQVKIDRDVEHSPQVVHAEHQAGLRNSLHTQPLQNRQSVLTVLSMSEFLECHFGL